MPSITSVYCPHCGQRAPIVLRGIEARCTACGGARIPFTGKSLNLAGKPSRIGGMAAKVLGAVVLVLGSSLGLGLGLLAHAFFGTVVALAVALPIAIVTLTLGLALVLGGRKLSKSGDEASLAVQKEALMALVAHRRGVVTAAEVGHALEITPAAADALLTRMAQEPEADVSLDVDDDGVIHYLFGKDALALRIEAMGSQRIDVNGDAAMREAAAVGEMQAEPRRQRR